MKDPFRLTGHLDGLIEVKPGDIRIADYKTINGKEFKELERPHADHVMQVHGYFKGVENTDTLPVKVNADSALLIYFSKQHEAKTMPVKAFHVTRSEMVERTLDRILLPFAEAVRDETALPAPLQRCVRANFGDCRAKNCPTKELCQRLLVQ